MKGHDRDWAAEGFDPEDAMTTPTPRTVKQIMEDAIRDQTTKRASELMVELMECGVQLERDLAAAQEARDSYKEKFNKQCADADEQTRQRVEADKRAQRAEAELASLSAVCMPDDHILAKEYLDRLERAEALAESYKADAERFFPPEFEVWQGDAMEASASGERETALREAMNYACQYAQDGPVRVFEVRRILVATIAGEPK